LNTLYDDVAIVLKSEGSEHKYSGNGDYSTSIQVQKYGSINLLANLFNPGAPADAVRDLQNAYSLMSFSANNIMQYQRRAVTGSSEEKVISLASDMVTQDAHVQTMRLAELNGEGVSHDKLARVSHYASHSTAEVGFAYAPVSGTPGNLAPGWRSGLLNENLAKLRDLGYAKRVLTTYHESDWTETDEGTRLVLSASDNDMDPTITEMKLKKESGRGVVKVSVSFNHGYNSYTEDHDRSQTPEYKQCTHVVMMDIHGNRRRTSSSGESFICEEHCKARGRAGDPALGDERFIGDEKVGVVTMDVAINGIDREERIRFLVLLAAANGGGDNLTQVDIPLRKVDFDENGEATLTNGDLFNYPRRFVKSLFDRSVETA
jgi:hypothetical protein